MQRRGFIKNTVVFAGIAFGGWMPVGIAARAPTKPEPPPPRVPLSGQFSYDHFRAYIGETFYVYGGQGLRNVVNLQLVAVDSYRQSQQTEQFVARFLGPDYDLLEGGVYQFQHSTGGEFQLLIAPTISDKKGQRYRADFNLLR